jgi:hypothetical protein
MEARIVNLGLRIAALVERLRAVGYIFERPDEVFPGPDRAAPNIIRRVESTVGEVPLALKLFWTRVGSVDLTGSHPEWPDPSAYLDQLVIFLPDVAIYYLEDYLSGEVRTFELVIAPDYFHKANVSGGSPYTVSVPAVAIDPPMNSTPSPETFLEHIESALRFGGFPGLADCPDHAWPLCELAGAEC